MDWFGVLCVIYTTVSKSLYNSYTFKVYNEGKQDTKENIELFK